MALGGIAAIAGVSATDSLLIGTLAAIGIGVVMGLLFALTTVVFRVNQVVSGLAFTFLGTGLATWAGTSYSGKPAAVSFDKISLPVL